VWGDQDLHGSAGILRITEVNGRKQSRTDSEMIRVLQTLCLSLRTKTEMVAEEEEN
jgi:hypothetical protein